MPLSFKMSLYIIYIGNNINVLMNYIELGGRMVKQKLSQNFDGGEKEM